MATTKAREARSLPIKYLYEQLDFRRDILEHPSPTMYKFAGGQSAFDRLAEAQYRRCLEDPILSQVFGTVADPEHAPRLAAWLAEVFGGPKTYSEGYGGHEGMI